jgi:aminoglycoside N3'-acetyltransferase
VTLPYSVTQLAQQLRALGIGANDIVMIHASMRRVGPVEGGASSVIEALRIAVGPGGTLVMVLSADEDAPFDALQSPVDVEDMGILAELFRTYPGVSVSDHPADRFAALGPLASVLLEPTPLHDYHGPGSVLERLTERGGKVLRLGAHPDTVTLTHYAEYLADIPDKVRVCRRYVRADTGVVWIESLDDTDGIATWDEGDYFPQIFLDYRASGAVRIGPVGRCEAELFEAAPFVTFAVEWMERHLVAARDARLDAEFVAQLFREWRRLGLCVWLDGGFCVEALVGRSMRRHADLDLAVEHRDVGRFTAWCDAAGFVAEPSDSPDIVVLARGGSRIDAHIVEHDADGAWVSGIAYPTGSLTGQTTIAGEAVRCVAPEWLFRFKTSYPPLEKDRIDVRALCDRFGWPVPPGYS